MITVNIDGELVAQASHLIDGRRWNGFVVPVFTTEQRDAVNAEFVRLGWHGDQDNGWTLGAEWENLGNGEWTTRGWTWCEGDGK